jgi:hypothetical protein
MTVALLTFLLDRASTHLLAKGYRLGRLQSGFILGRLHDIILFDRIRNLSYE